MKALTVTMPDGSILAVPVLMVATNRATPAIARVKGQQ